MPAGTLLQFDQARLRGTIAVIERQAHTRAVARVGAAPGLTGVLTIGPNPVLTSEQTPAEIVVANRSADLLTGVRVELIQADKLGLRQAVVVIENNFAGQNPFVFSIQGEGIDSSGQLLFKDGFE